LTSTAGFGGGQKTETALFFRKTEPKPTDLGQCETVTTLNNNNNNMISVPKNYDH